uniref:Uncharacterized protein n=3 Tax=Parascaris univalens TaxID=6257 RepID=A0A914ZYC0_PARUN
AMKRSVTTTLSNATLCSVDRSEDSEMGLTAKQRKLIAKKAEMMKEKEKLNNRCTVNFIKGSLEYTAYLNFLRSALDAVEECAETESSKLHRCEASMAHLSQMIGVVEAITEQGGVGDDVYMTKLNEEIESLKISDQMQALFKDKLNSLERLLNTRIETGSFMERIAQLDGFDQKVTSAGARVEAFERTLTKNEDEIIDELAYLNQKNAELDQSVRNSEKSEVELIAERKEKLEQVHVLQEKFSNYQGHYATLEINIGNMELDVTALEARANDASILNQLLLDQTNCKAEKDRKEEEILRYEAEIKNMSKDLGRHQQQVAGDTEKAEKATLSEDLMRQLSELHATKVILDEELASMEVTLGDNGEMSASHFEERAAQLKKAKTETEKKIDYLRTAVADYRDKLLIVNEKIEMLNIEHRVETLTSQKQLLQKAYRKAENKSGTVTSNLIGVMLRRKHLRVEMASLSANLSHRTNVITQPVEFFISHCKDRNFMRIPGASDTAVNTKINNVVEGAEGKEHGQFASERRQRNHRQQIRVLPPRDKDNSKQMWMNALEALSPSPLERTSVQSMTEASLNQMDHKSDYSAESSQPTAVPFAVNGRSSNTNRIAPVQCVQDGDVSQYPAAHRYPIPPSAFSSPISDEEHARIDACLAVARDFPPEVIQSDADQSTWSLIGI